MPPDSPKQPILDPNPERRRHLTQILGRVADGQLSLADLKGFSKKKLFQLAETGYVKFKYGRLSEAKEIFGGLAKIDHRNYYYHSVLGGIYQKEKNFVDAVVEYTQALRLYPKDTASLVNRGEIYLRHRNYKKAALDFRNAILLDATGRNLWANRARSLVIAIKRNLDMKKN